MNPITFAVMRRRFVSASGSIEVGAHETWVGVSSGGGGWGDPLQRDTGDVVRDVTEGVITIATARAVFSVVLAPDGTLNQPATAALRAASGGPDRPALALVSPSEPGVGVWAQREMREGDVYLLNPVL